MKEVPSDWDFLRSRFLFNQRSSKNHPEEPLLSVTQEKSLVRRDELGTNVWNPDSDISGYKLVKDGDFVISLRSFEGGLELSEVQGIVSPAYTVFYPIRRISSRYFKYLFKCHEFILELNRYVSGIRQGKNISYSDFSEISLPIPSLARQNEIGQYLDRKTTLIDSLIEKTVRKIELLKEKRTSLINEVVTKGLDPDVEMKDSGVEWIGEIPSHWGVTKYKYHFRIKGGFPFDSELITNEPTEFPIIRIGNVTSGEIDVYYSGELSEKIPVVEQGDYVISLTGDFSIRRWERKTALLNQRCGLVVPREGLDHRYLFYVLPQSFNVLEKTKYFTTLKNLSNSEVEDIVMCCPPQHEQEQIVEYLEKETSTIDSTITKEEKRIEFLKEYRQSLISEAVTGKIKVS